MAAWNWSLPAIFASYVTVNSSVSRLTSTFLTPASSDRAAETASGQLIHVAPLLLFIIPSTTMVTLDIATSAASLCANNEFDKAAMTTWIISKRFGVESITSYSIIPTGCVIVVGPTIKTRRT